MKILVLVFCAVAVVSSTPVDSKPKDVITQLGVDKCVDSKDPTICLKEHALDALLRLEGARTLKLFNGVTLFNSSPRKSRTLEPLSTDSDVRNKQLTERLWKTTTELLESSDVELSFSPDDEEAETRAIDEVDEGRGKKKKKKKKLKKKLKILIPLLILAKIKAVALAVIALLLIAASLFKLTLIAKIALIIKIVTLIKAALLAKKHQHQHQEETWEIAAPPQSWEPDVEHTHVEHGQGWEGGWSRTRNDGSNLAYSAYAN